jgi:hypothetical protein
MELTFIVCRYFGILQVLCDSKLTTDGKKTKKYSVAKKLVGALVGSPSKRGDGRECTDINKLSRIVTLMVGILIPVTVSLLEGHSWILLAPPPISSHFRGRREGKRRGTVCAYAMGRRLGAMAYRRHAKRHASPLRILTKYVFAYTPSPPPHHLDRSSWVFGWHLLGKA